MIPALIIVSMLGLLIGSFLNVVISRLPNNESIVFPGSHCPKCDSKIAFYDNIPVISYLVLLGKCRNCREKISLLYPFVELLNCVGYFLIFQRYGLSLVLPVYLLLYSSLVVVTFIDLEHMIIPDEITLPGIIIGFICAVTVLPISPLDSIIGIFLGGFLFYLAGFFSELVLRKEGMGGGDVKLIAMLGGFLGWQKMLLIIMLSAGLGSVIGITIMVFSKKNKDGMIPYGPFLSIAAFVSILKGNELLNWYLNFLGR